MRKAMVVGMAAVSIFCLIGCGKGKEKDVALSPEATVTAAPSPTEEIQPTEEVKPTEAPEPEKAKLADGVYSIEVTLGGGSGRTTITSPAKLTVLNGAMVATIEWSSSNYDYMLVDGEKYLPVNTEGNSVFEIPVAALDEELNVIGDTVAMSKPREIEYTLLFHSDSMEKDN